MKKKPEKKTVSENDIPVGVYPELDRDLGRDRDRDAFNGLITPGFQPGVINSGYPWAVYPGFDSGFPHGNEENNLTAGILEGTWPNPQD